MLCGAIQPSRCAADDERLCEDGIWRQEAFMAGWLMIMDAVLPGFAVSIWFRIQIYFSNQIMKPNGYSKLMNLNDPAVKLVKIRL